LNTFEELSQLAQNKLTKLLEEHSNNINIQPFAPLVSPLIEETLKEANMTHYRKGTVLIPSLLIWIVLAMAVRRDLCYHKLLNWLFSKIRLTRVF